MAAEILSDLGFSLALSFPHIACVNYSGVCDPFLWLTFLLWSWLAHKSFINHFAYIYQGGKRQNQKSRRKSCHFFLFFLHYVIFAPRSCKWFDGRAPGLTLKI